MYDILDKFQFRESEHNKMFKDFIGLCVSTKAFLSLHQQFAGVNHSRLNTRKLIIEYMNKP